MFFRPIPLFELFGFRVRLDASWFLLAILIVWSLSTGVFPQTLPTAQPSTWWWMGVLALIGLAASIVLHELAHSLVARRFDMPIRGITLFIFGGIAEMQDEPTSARGEMLMAAAGPAASFAIAALLYGLAWLPWPAPLGIVLGYLAIINLVLAVFNLVPAFPLDGGRILRAALWGWGRDLVWATRIAAFIGGVFGLLLIVLGLVSAFTGNLIGGLWYFLIGLFVRSAASGALQAATTREAFAGRPVADFMRRDPVAVDADATLRTLVDEYFLRHYHKAFPVLSHGRLIGCAHIDDLKAIPSERRAFVPVRAIMGPCGDDRVVSPDTDAAAALRLMQRTGQTRLIVARNGSLQGMVSIRDLLSYLSIAQDLGGHGPSSVGGDPPGAGQERPAGQQRTDVDRMIAR